MPLPCCAAEQVANPTDPSGYRALMIDCFIKRGILEEADRTAADRRRRRCSSARRSTSSTPSTSIAASRGGAYRFLDDNRAKLFIPLNVDLVVPEIVRANKLHPRRRCRCPSRSSCNIIWREEVLLEGERFGRFAGERTTMLCGATMVLDQNGNHDSLGAQARHRQTSASRRAALAERVDGVATAQGASRHDRGAHRGGHDRRDYRQRTRPARRATPPFARRSMSMATIRFGLAPHFSLGRRCTRTTTRETANGR